MVCPREEVKEGEGKDKVDLLLSAPPSYVSEERKMFRVLPPSSL